MARTDLTKPFNKFEVLGQAWFAKFRVAAAKVVRWKRGGAFAGHGPGKQSGSHGGIGDHANSAFFAIRKSFGFNLAANK